MEIAESSSFSGSVRCFQQAVHPESQVPGIAVSISESAFSTDLFGVIFVCCCWLALCFK